MQKNNLIPILKALFAVLVWGGSFVATKVALKEVSPVTVVWLRFGMGFIVLGLGVLSRRQFAIPSRADAAYFALLGFLGITFHQWLQSTGLTTAQATTTSWIVATTPVFMVLLGWLVLKEKISWLQALGVLIAALGVLAVVSKGDPRALFSGRAGTIGDLLVLISAPNWAVFSTLSRRGLNRHPAARMMFYVMGFGFLFTSVLFFIGSGFSEIGRLSTNGWLGIAFLGILCSGIAYIFWYDALQAMPVAQAGAFVYIEPFVTVIVAALILGEPLLLSSLLGGATIILGVWLVNQRQQKKPAAAAEQNEPGLADAQ